MPAKAQLPSKDQIAMAGSAILRFKDAMKGAASPFAPYRYQPVRYVSEKLGWEPWSGETEEEPGQVQVFEHYARTMRQLIERRDFQAGDLTERDLTVWSPSPDSQDNVIENWIRVPAGFNLGKTKLASGMVNHFFDCFSPALIYTFAPNWTQIHDLLWKEIKSDRTGKGLPGAIFDLELRIAWNHFAKGRATDNAGGKGSERVQGQHGPFLMMVLDEAEGIPEFVWKAVRTMTSGGVAIVLMLANPRERTTEFHRVRDRKNCRTFRIAELWHPNVKTGRAVIPGSVEREFVDDFIDHHAEVVAEPDEDSNTFSVSWRPGIFKPDAECQTTVLGIAPSNTSDRTVIPVGRYEAAVARDPAEVPYEDPRIARMGVDVARYGHDKGNLYIRHRGQVWRAEVIADADGFEYARRIKEHAGMLAEQGVVDLQIRVDGNGTGATVVDALAHDEELGSMFPGESPWVIDVIFGESARDPSAYGNLISEIYFEAAESIKGLAIIDPPLELEDDLCARTYEWVNRRGHAVRLLTEKDRFRKDYHRSPDDGDGFALAVAPDFLFMDVADVFALDDPVTVSPY